MTRTTGGAGNDEDAGNGDVCVCTCTCASTHVCVCVWTCTCALDTRAARTESKHGSMATTLHTWQGHARQAVTRTTGGDKDDRRRRERRGRREWRRVCVCTCTCASTHVLRGWSAPQFLASPGRVPPPPRRGRRASMAAWQHCTRLCVQHKQVALSALQAQGAEPIALLPLHYCHCIIAIVDAGAARHASVA